MPKKDAKKRAPRAPSAYNLFMRSEIKKVKKANSNMDHKTAFTTAAHNWTEQKK